MLRVASEGYKYGAPFFQPTCHFITVNLPNLTKQSASTNPTNPFKQFTYATMSAQDIPSGDFQDNDYKSRTGQNQIPVQSDDKTVEDPIDGNTADSDAQLGSFSA